MNGSALGIRYVGVRFLPVAFGAVFASEHVVLPQLGCSYCHRKAGTTIVFWSLSPFLRRATSSLCQAAGLKRVIIDSRAAPFALDSPTLSQTSRNAFARSSTSRSLL